MLRFIAVKGIRFYQKYLSARKGYKCAHGVLHQDGTCSSIILNIVKNNSISKWRNLISAQFDSCKSAKVTIDKKREEDKKKDKNCGRNACSDLSCDSSSCISTKKCGKMDDCTPDMNCDGCDVGSC